MYAFEFHIIEGSSYVQKSVVLLLHVNFEIIDLMMNCSNGLSFYIGVLRVVQLRSFIQVYQPYRVL